MSMSHEAAPKAQISLVPADQTGQADAGSALIVGPFPPLIGPSAGHASALLHLFKENGYRVRSATGPGLALARHTFNFASETKLRNSSAFLSHCDGDAFAVLYAKSFDFAKVSKPRWYKRRLEELRRLRLLGRIIGTYQSTSLIFESRPYLSRYQVSLWAVARAVGWFKRSEVRIVHGHADASDVFKTLTGIARPVPTAYKAEETAYASAFSPDGPTPVIRLTIARAEQALNFWVGRTKDRENSKTTRDLRELMEVCQTFDMQSLPHFRFLWDAAATMDVDVKVASRSKKAKSANSLLDSKETFGVPITRYMRHLWVSVGPHRRHRLKNRTDAEQLLNWYLFEAAKKVPAKQVPVIPKVRDYYLSSVSKAVPVYDPKTATIVHARGRDMRPFALSPSLAALANSDHPIAQKYDVDNPVERLGFVLEALLTQSTDAADQISIGASAEAYLNAPIGDDPANVSRLEFLLAVQGRCQLDGRDAVETPWTDISLRRFAQDHCAEVFPGLRALTNSPRKTHKPPRQFAISGLPRSETGVGSNLHMSHAALTSAGVVPHIYDTADGMRVLNQDASRPHGLRLKRSAALHHVNADLAPQSVLAPVFGSHPNMLHIGFLLWEFDVLPKSHLLALDLLDEIWTPTEFLRGVYANACDKPVRNMLKGLHIPQTHLFDLGEIGIDDGCTTFLTCFDFHSSVARKNPLAAVQAFKSAFPKHRRDVRLIVKTTPSVESHWGDPENQMRKIHQLAASDDRITLVAQYYSFNRLLSLIAACDCLISPHRAEGFGLMPAYALGLARTVIATDYSGTTDFCTPVTSYPIPFRKVPVERHQVLHPLKGASWAEIDKDALVSTMRAVVENPTLGETRARAGRTLIKDRFSPNRQADRYKARLTELGII